MVNPNIARDFVYVEDVIEAYLRAATRRDQEPGAVYNVGTGIQAALYEVFDVARRVMGITVEPQWGSRSDRIILLRPLPLPSVLVMFSSRIIFLEHVPPLRFFGVVLIILGLLLASLARDSENSFLTAPSPAYIIFPCLFNTSSFFRGGPFLTRSPW